MGGTGAEGDAGGAGAEGEVRGAGGAAPYTDAARARLLMAYEACELADLARASVPVGERELNPDGTAASPGAALADAARVLRAARRLVAAAAVFERVGGAGWRLVGDVLEIPASLARARFARDEARFRRRLSSACDTAGADDAGEADRLRTHMAREPLETALDLDEWVLDHADGDTAPGAGPGTAPVSGGLARRQT